MFQLGHIYNRKKDLHENYGGQQRGGIATPINYPLIILFTGESGTLYGYQDSIIQIDRLDVNSNP